LYNAITDGSIPDKKAEEHKADIIRIFQEHFDEVDKLIYTIENLIKEETSK
jgi:hypothetical protein